VAPPGRAPALTPEDRREAILDAVVPLLAEHSTALTSRQIAEAAGVAEGTVFRAFGDKDTLIEAAVTRFLQPDALRAALREVDASLPLPERLEVIIDLLRARFRGVVRVMSTLGAKRRDAGPERPSRIEFAEIIVDLLAPDAYRLGWPSTRVAYLARMLAFSAEFPGMHHDGDFTSRELADVLLNGVVTR
jgi:AcrR family transcriptional regulator